MCAGSNPAEGAFSALRASPIAHNGVIDPPHVDADNDGMRPGRWFAAIAIVAVGGALAAGCSSGGDSTQSRSSSSTSSAAPPSTAATATSTSGNTYAAGHQDASFDVGGTTRTAVIVVPGDASRPAPLVFAFHGHGGNGTGMERRSNIEGLWPDAIVVYPDGLVGHKGKTDPEGVRTGWQTLPGEDGDRDLAFYDTMLAALRSQLPVDSDRVYVMGHSNGSGFASLLLNQRGDAIAATANLSAQPPARLLASDPARSMFMAMGTNDTVVPYDTQKRSIPVAEQKLEVDPNRATVTGFLRAQPGRGGLELQTYVYPGGHAPPPEVPKLVVDFFRRHTLSGG
jgi:polyhydroxybutyrate depolymerase